MIDKESIIRIALEKYSNYWSFRKDELSSLVNNAADEIKKLEESSGALGLPLSSAEAKKIKAIWVISGVGTYFKPITDTAGDSAYKDKPWAQFSDRKRIDYALKVIRNISMVASGKYKTRETEGSKVSDSELKEIIEEFGPHLIYNGIKQQDVDLISAMESGEVLVPKSKLFIPKGEISKTLDQIQFLKLPSDLNIQDGDVIGIVSHAPHLARVMRMINKYKPFPKGIKVKLFPLIFQKPENEDEFAQAEIMGILGYVSRSEAAFKPYPYEL